MLVRIVENGWVSASSGALFVGKVWRRRNHDKQGFGALFVGHGDETIKHYISPEHGRHVRDSVPYSWGKLIIEAGLDFIKYLYGTIIPIYKGLTFCGGDA